MARTGARATIASDEGEGPTTLDAFFGYNLKRAYMVLYESYRRALGDDSMSPRAFSALALIVELPGLKQTSVAQRLGINRSGVVAIIDDLEQKGFVERANTPGDRRVFALFPTAAGQLAYHAARGELAREEALLFADFTKAEKRTLLALLQKIRAKEQG